MNQEEMKAIPGWKLLEIAGVLKQTINMCEITGWSDLRRKAEVKLEVVDKEIARRLTAGDKRDVRDPSPS